MPGGKLKRELVAMCCALACTGCQTLWDASRHLATGVCAPSAPYEEADPELAASSPEVRELVSVAHAHHLNGEPDLAATALLDALEFEPDNRRVRTILAITLALEGHLQAAELQFIEALGMAEAQYNLGIILFEQGDVKAAEQRFVRAIQHDSSLQDARVWLDVARRKLAVQTAMWHTEIHPQPISPRRTDVEREVQLAAVVPLPAPLPVIQASAVVLPSESPPPIESLPTIAPIQLATGHATRVAAPKHAASPLARGEGGRRPDDGGPIQAAASNPDSAPPHPPFGHPLRFKGEREQSVPRPVNNEERAELDHLRKEVERLRLEHQILKKAIGVIAADDDESAH